MARVSILNDIISNVEKVIVDKRYQIQLLLITLLCEGHILIEDIPGVGKTSMASALAKSLSCSFKRIQFTPDIMPSDITGFSIFSPKTGEFEYQAGSLFSQIVLADEINRTSPKTQASLLEAMEEQQVTVDGKTYQLPRPFMVLATQNPVDYLGTYPLPEAQMDRFFMRISLGYPSLPQEVEMLNRFRQEPPLRSLMPVATAEEIIKLQQTVKDIHVDPKVSQYIVALVTHTRNNPYTSLGGSPRASIALYKASQAWALCQNRPYVIPDDVREMSRYVIAHRIILKQEAKLKKISQDDIVTMALKEVPLPRMAQ